MTDELVAAAALYLLVGAVFGSTCCICWRSNAGKSTTRAEVYKQAMQITLQWPLVLIGVFYFSLLGSDSSGSPESKDPNAKKLG